MKLKDIIWVLFISMLPLIELRGAIPVGAVLGLPFYINYALAVVGNLLPVPFILLFIPKILDFLARFKLFRPVVLWLHQKADKNRGKIAKEAQNTEAIAMDNSAEISVELNTDITDISKQELISDHTDTSGEGLIPSIAPEPQKRSLMPAGAFIGLMLFVLLPLPGTGAWTGALVAALFGFPRLKSFISILLGVLGCGVIMCLASYGVLGFLSFLL